MRASDIITAFLTELLEENGGNLELQRNELAQRFNVVPSQINYVISSRFTREHGYVTESRRGGGGYIRITRVRYDKPARLMHILHSVGDRLSAFDAALFIKGMTDNEFITAEAGKIIGAALSDTALASVPPEKKDAARADIFKNILCSMLT